MANNGNYWGFLSHFCTDFVEPVPVVEAQNKDCLKRRPFSFYLSPFLESADSIKRVSGGFSFPCGRVPTQGPGMVLGFLLLPFLHRSFLALFPTADKSRRTRPGAAETDKICMIQRKISLIFSDFIKFNHDFIGFSKDSHWFCPVQGGFVPIHHKFCAIFPKKPLTIYIYI